jgi:hypothetical protein
MSIHPHLPVLKPSAEARLLYNQMIAKADGEETDDQVPYLSLEKTLSLKIDRRKQGRDTECNDLLYELVAEQWISVDSNYGGWRLSCSAKA